MNAKEQALAICDAVITEHLATTGGTWANNHLHLRGSAIAEKLLDRLVAWIRWSGDARRTGRTTCLIDHIVTERQANPGRKIVVVTENRERFLEPLRRRIKANPEAIIRGGRLEWVNLVVLSASALTYTILACIRGLLVLHEQPRLHPRTQAYISKRIDTGVISSQWTTAPPSQPSAPRHPLPWSHAERLALINGVAAKCEPHITTTNWNGVLVAMDWIAKNGEWPDVHEWRPETGNHELEHVRAECGFAIRMAQLHSVTLDDKTRERLAAAMGVEPPETLQWWDALNEPTIAESRESSMNRTGT